MHGLSYEQRLEILGLPSLSVRRTITDLIFVHKILNNFYELPLRQMFILNNRRELRGHLKKLIKSRFRKQTRQYFFSVRVVGLWNSLPDNIVRSRSVYGFRTCLYQFFNR
jgi:hypothetical protein